MPRNSSGTFTLAEAAFVPNTPILSADVNSDFSDIATAITESLSRTGQGGMQALLNLDNSGLAYSSDPDTGLLRTSANTQAIRVGGADWVFNATGLLLPASAVIQDNTGADIAFALGVPYFWVSGTPPTGCVFCFGQACTNAAAPLLRALLIANSSPFGNNGTDPLFPDGRGIAIVGKSNMGGVDRGNFSGGTVLGAGSASALGEQAHTLTIAETPAITPVGTNADSATTSIGSAVGGLSAGGTTFFTQSGTPVVSGTAVGQTFTGTPQGGGGSHNNVQPSLVLNIIMRAK